ncbi:MAG: Na+/H+ antiporter NhaA [Actinomycetota bacterium]
MTERSDRTSHTVDDRVDLRPSWLYSGRRVPRLVLRPLQAFLQTEYGGGLVLLVFTLAALTWANAPWHESYERVWRSELAINVGPWHVAHDVRQWINEGLMTIFFLVVGLEIKRELVSGELSDRRAAALPVIAAIGGMVVPASIYLAFNQTGASVRGWGIPMATDIAFAVAVLSLAAPKLPRGVRAFLLALAIVDDIGAILVIAIFYSGDIEWLGLLVAAGVLAAIRILRRVGVRSPPLYVALGIAVWAATFASGLHATVAGVALGLITPAIPSQRPKAVSIEARRIADQTDDEPDPPDADAHHWLRLGRISRQAVSPLARLEHLLHPWSSYVIVPLFALANAGVHITAEGLRAAATSSVTIGIMIGLVVGKPVGVTVASWVGVRAGLTRLPGGIGWRHVIGTGMVAGIGFTVSLIITDLAFTTRQQVPAKLGVLAASITAGVIGSLLLRRWVGRP